MTVLQPGDRIGPYRVEKAFAEHQGGFAQVVLGRRASSQDEGGLVAVKIARSLEGDRAEIDAYDRALSNEVETLRVLKHPAIVRMYPIQIDDHHFSYMARSMELPGSPWYFVMEYLSGDSVEAMVKVNGALEPALAIEIAYQICAALDYLHLNDFAHLDIKTNNILMRRPLDDKLAPEAVLIDFGAAQKNVRRAEVEAGALVYLPPERVEVMIGAKAPETVLDKGAVDVYSLGVTLYRMLTGELPFSGRRSRVTTAILNETPTHPMSMNENLRQYPELDALIMQMLDKRPERRPDVKDIMTKLDQIMPPPRFIVGHNLAPKRTGPGKKWKYLALALVAAFLIQLIILLLLLPQIVPPAEGGTGPIAKTATPVPTIDEPLTLPTGEITPTTSLAPTETASTGSGGGLITSSPTDNEPGDESEDPPVATDATPTIAATKTPTATRIPPTATPRPTATPIPG